MPEINILYLILYLKMHDIGKVVTKTNDVFQEYDDITT